MPAEYHSRLRSLESERDRLEQLLEADEAWRALRQLDEREGAGRPLSAVDAEGVRAKLETALEGNRLYVARRKISEAIALLREIHASASAEADTNTRKSAHPVVTIAAIEARATQILPPDSAEAPDDLTLIRPISRDLARRLGTLGVRSFEDIAGWTAADVARISRELEIGRLPSQQNWIEQAALLASRKPVKASGTDALTIRVSEPEVSRRIPGGSVTSAAAATVPTAPTPSRAIAELVASAARSILARAKRPRTELAAAAPHEEPDDLMLLDGMTGASADILRDMGVRRFRDVAGWSAADAARVRSSVEQSFGQGAACRIGGWIEEAAMRAAGVLPHRQMIESRFGGVPLAPAPTASETQCDGAFASWLRQHATPQRTAAPSTASSEDVEVAAPPPVTVGGRSPAHLEEQAREEREDDPPQCDPREDDTQRSDAAIPGVIPQHPAPLSPRFDLVVRVLPPEPLPPATADEVARDETAADVASAQAEATALVDTVEAEMQSAASAPARLRLEIVPLPELPFLPSQLLPEGAGDGEATMSPDQVLDPLALPEARVEIVRKAPYLLAPKVGEPETPPPQGSNTLYARLRETHRRTEDFDGPGYAAYRVEVEEASVEIVRPGQAVDSQAEGPSSVGRPEATSREREATASGVGSERSGSVRRFLDALTGQGRE